MTVHGAIQAARRWRLAERGTSSIAVFILMLPLIVGIFGFGLDIMRWTYAKNYAQGRLNLALETAMTYRYTNATGNTVLGEPGFPDQVQIAGETYYQINTSDKRNVGNGGLLTCAEADMLYSPDESCALTVTLARTFAGQTYDFCADPGAVNYVGVEGTAVESIDTLFLRMFGINDLTFTVNSYVPLRGGNC